MEPVELDGGLQGKALLGHPGIQAGELFDPLEPVDQGVVVGEGELRELLQIAAALEIGFQHRDKLHVPGLLGVQQGADGLLDVCLDLRVRVVGVDQPEQADLMKA